MSVTRSQYKVGQTPRLTVTFADADGAPTDPSAIVFSMTEPDDDATVTPYTYGTDTELVRVDVGVYYVDWEVAYAGEHCYTFRGTGALKAFNSRQFDGVGACA